MQQVKFSNLLHVTGLVKESRVASADGILKCLNLQRGQSTVTSTFVRFKHFSKNWSKKHVRFPGNKSSSEEATEPNPNILHGRNLCNIAIKHSRRPVLRVFAKESWQFIEPSDERVRSVLAASLARSLPIEFVSLSKLSQMSGGKSHQGICVEAGPLPVTAVNNSITSELVRQNCQPLWVMLHDVYDPGNVGAILRTCSFLGLDKVFLTSSCAPMSNVVCKTSSGASELLKIYSVPSPVDFIEKLQQQENWDILGTDVEPSGESAGAGCLENTKYTDVSEVKLRKSSLLLLGSEGTGLPDEMKSMCDRLISITPVGGADKNTSVSCMNVSAATAIILHRLLK